MSETFLYLTTTGRTTGQPRRIEIWFVEHESRYYLCSERREESGWVKNLRADPRVHLSIGPRDAPASVVAETAALARPIEEGPTLGPVKARFDEKYGWSDGLIVEIAPV